MAKKCVHKGCGQNYDDDTEPCVYHPGPPEFHEGQKGWKCCKPRVLTFDEFLAIPPCTTGTHSDVDDTPAATPKAAEPAPEPAATEALSAATAPRLPQAQASGAPTAAAKSPAPPEDESDDETLPIAAGQACRRRGCSATYAAGAARDAELCVHHPGVAIFHEGSKGWSCCKRRVLEFDQFMKIEGCATKTRHLFVGKKKEEGQEDVVDTVRHDFYQTPTSVIASLFLKKIDKDTSTIAFSTPTSITLDLRTADHKRYQAELPLFAPIDPEKSAYKVLGTKLELTLVKADGASWPVLRVDDPRTGEIIQTGRAGRVG
ncbi:uncharacterized protein K452DRAFT_221043 [Aplosporella prunicola CBS 121167]|uniref:CS domain-containing protein n=1 Tax=Aplosporella prunicola CBS 121167 TaxID=1176127 RepID=A0A6A6BQT5_9PEZI|nr:uncharacterized protein K452DRAFT_221043 [Aplosporella prunicola CBS 121167]KAF2145604.1 hypothetical protein K452DRAFT_221043 [Aplosporella prunicola CBS 121167]